MKVELRYTQIRHYHTTVEIEPTEHARLMDGILGSSDDYRRAELEILGKYAAAGSDAFNVEDTYLDEFEPAGAAQPEDVE